jgi:hypothetical protein
MQLGYAGYEVTEAVIIGATGTAVLKGAIGGLTGCINSGAATSVRSSDTPIAAKASGGAAAYVALQVLGGLVGYGILMNTGITSMALGPVAASMATGAAIFSAIPLTIGLCCCIAAVAGGAGAVVVAAAVADPEKAEDKLEAVVGRLGFN